MTNQSYDTRIGKLSFTDEHGWQGIKVSLCLP